MKTKLLLISIVITGFLGQGLFAQNCPGSIGNSSTTTRPHFKIASQTCNEYPNSITINGSTFTKGACNGTNLFYDLDSGQSPLPSEDTFTVNFGNGDCVYVNGELQTLFISHNSVAESVQIYPIPASLKNGLYLKGPIGLQLEVFLVDMNGRIVLEEKKVLEGNDKLNINGLSDGVYFIKLISEDGANTKKVILRN